MSSQEPGAGARVEDDEEGTSKEVNGRNRKKRTGSPASSCSTPTSSVSAANSPSAATINLRREYTLAVQTNSYNEMWARIHYRNGGEVEGEVAADRVGGEILRPDRASIEEALRLVQPTRLSRLVSRYLESSEQASDLFISLRRSVDLAREIYAPIAQLLDVLPAFTPIPSPGRPAPLPLSLPQCNRAFDIFIDFDRRANPFPSSADASRGFEDIRDCFSVLKQQLELRLLTARRRHRLLRRATTASATCLVVLAAGAVAAILVLASHALLAVAAMGPAGSCCIGGDVMAGRRRQLRKRIADTDAAARETYVLDNNLRTVERLVARLHATVESDKVLVRLGLERGPDQIHPIQEVLRQLRKNNSSFRHQLTDLDEHVCLCLAALNRARYLLLQQIHNVRSTG